MKSDRPYLVLADGEEYVKLADVVAASGWKSGDGEFLSYLRKTAVQSGDYKRIVAAMVERVNPNIDRVGHGQG